MKKYCSQCNREFDADARWCDQCGSELISQNPASAPQQQPAPKTAQTNYKMCTNPDCESHKRGDRYPVLEFICAYCGKELE